MEFEATTPRRKGILAWLGLGVGENAEQSAADHAPDEPCAAASRRISEEIGDFLADLQLPVTHLSLAVALDCVSGNDPALAAEIVRRRSAGEAVTMEWLIDARRPAEADDEARAMSKLMDRFEGSLDEFGRATQEVRTATRDYGKALSTHVDEMNQVGSEHVMGAGSALGEFVAMARAMIERTNAMEQRIARSERETRSLRRQLDETRRDAELDHLTGLPNRRAFETRFDREVVAARAGGEPLCIAFCDIDRFKRINDTHGHDAGDRVIKVVAHVLNDLSDDRCHVARHGGEEFVVLLRGRTLPEAWQLLDEARANLADRRMVNRATEVPFGKVTFSAGLADVLAYAEPRAALKAADQALYAAKHEGRNRVTIADANATDPGFSPPPPVRLHPRAA